MRVLWRSVHCTLALPILDVARAPSGYQALRARQGRARRPLCWPRLAAVNVDSKETGSARNLGQFLRHAKSSASIRYRGRAAMFRIGMPRGSRSSLRGLVSQTQGD